MLFIKSCLRHHPQTGRHTLIYLSIGNAIDVDPKTTIPGVGVISTGWEISRCGFARSIDKHKPIATRTALTLSVLRATYRCLCCLRYFDNACIYKHCRTKLSSLRSVGMTSILWLWVNRCIVTLFIYNDITCPKAPHRGLLRRSG